MVLSEVEFLSGIWNKLWVKEMLRPRCLKEFMLGKSSLQLRLFEYLPSLYKKEKIIPPPPKKHISVNSRQANSCILAYVPIALVCFTKDPFCKMGSKT